MPPHLAAGSPSRPSRSKRESMTITRSVGKALSDVMNKNKASSGTCDAADSGVGQAAASGGPAPRRVPATTREGTRGSRPSLDLPRGASASGSDKLTPKLAKRPPTAPSSFPSKPATRQDKSSSAILSDSPSKPSEKASKPRTSLTLRGLSSALQPKPTHPPSALPKYKPKPAALSPSGARKRLSDWDGEREEAKGSEEDTDGDFVAVERPISPLPRRAARKSISPAPVCFAPSTSPKKGNILHKASSSISSTPPRASKASKASPASAAPISRLQNNQSSACRPLSSASMRTSPVRSPTRKPVSVARTGTMHSVHSVRRRLTLTDDSVSSSSKADASPGNPFQLPETHGTSLLSPPLSPFLEGVSLDSIDAGDVSAFLSTIVSPTKPASAPQTAAERETSSQALSHTEQRLPEDSTAPPPQTPILQSSFSASSTLATDPRQSMLSLRQFLEKSGDLEHLLSQPLPALLAPDARDRLLSIGFSPTFAPPPFPPGAHRPEPQTPSPVHHDERPFTSISQVLFPPRGGGAAPPPPPPPRAAQDGAAGLVALLLTQLASSEAQRAERDARLARLEGQLGCVREARAQEAAELAAQVAELETQLGELLRERERARALERRAAELEARLRETDAEWARRAAGLAARAEAQGRAEQERAVRAEQHRWSLRGAAEAWAHTGTVAVGELELVRSNRAFVQVTLAGLDLAMQQLRQSSMR